MKMFSLMLGVTKVLLIQYKSTPISSFDDCLSGDPDNDYPVAYPRSMLVAC